MPNLYVEEQSVQTHYGKGARKREKPEKLEVDQASSIHRICR